ncbi:zinc transporter ZIP2 isoform X3 [Callorhinus ursinus]|uniref:Zinc transporter ZIP2 isoform X3 n=2 Tax=Otariidae TaxID=9702 RepID=A0A3Q7QDL5_CALUR|nr:zinc transporter ZIP2 isoform X3 [Callorhinus ursinus]XP_027428245.1 zinc transporter ZIP2 isoform X3 [Zalophus californianus]XP_027950972.1 zinc transporter ZIP2 isoform X3 [Eumetopias jubatus]
MPGAISLELQEKGGPSSTGFPGVPGGSTTSQPHLLPEGGPKSPLKRMESLLGVKIGCLFALLVLTLVCGLIPICFKWFQIDAATGRHRRVLSLLGCTSAGVFLGAGLMHMTAEALEGIDSEIQKFKMQDRKGGKCF